LEHRRVLDELNIDAESRKKIEWLTRDFVAHQPGLFRGPGAFGPEQRQKFLERTRAHEQQVKALLTDEQARRLKQIDLQTRGPMAFRERDVVRALGLTPRQEARIKELQESSIARHCDQFSPKGPPHEDWKSHEQERDNLLGQI